MSHLVEHGFTLIKQGAEARIYSGIYLDKPVIIKERFSKSYRHPTLDATLTKERTKSEAKSMCKALQAGIRTPTIYLVDYHNNRIYMEHLLNALTVEEYIFDITNRMEKDSQDNAFFTKLLDKLAHKIGCAVGQMHKYNIIHGDLTTSNMLLSPPMDEMNSLDFNVDNGEIVLIDFGLSYIDPGSENKGVDLFVLDRALMSTHSTLPTLFDNIILSYRKENKNSHKDVIIKYNEARSRGRKRTMIG